MEKKNYTAVEKKETTKELVERAVAQKEAYKKALTSLLELEAALIIMEVNNND